MRRTNPAHKAHTLFMILERLIEKEATYQESKVAFAVFVHYAVHNMHVYRQTLQKRYDDGAKWKKDEKCQSKNGVHCSSHYISFILQFSELSLQNNLKLN